MKKSFKKALAAFLAALMVIFSVPFTALAAPGDYTPDIQLQFGTFHKDDATDWFDSETTASGDTYDMCGLYDVPLDYDAKAGTITMSAEKAAKAAEVVGFDVPSEDVQYGVGDYFTVTTIIDNVQKVCASEFYITYSENVEPAGVYKYTQKMANNRNKTLYATGTYSDFEATHTETTKSFTIGGLNEISPMSCTELYGGTLNYDGTGAAASKSIIKPENNYIFTSVVATNGYFGDVSHLQNDSFADPNTGALTGYAYDNACVAATFVFKITGEGPIVFDLTDKDNTVFKAFSGAYYVADTADGVMVYNYTTYAPTYGLSTTGSSDPSAGAENPGSRKMTFMGTNIHNGASEPEEPKVHTHTYDSVTTPAECEKDGYITFTCNNEDGLGTVGDDTYVEGVDLHPELAKLKHNYVSISETDSDCQTPGEIVYECTRCKDTYTDYKELSKTHTFTNYVSNDDAKCGVDGTETATCDVCHAATDTRTEEGSALTHNGVLAPETAVAATCAKDGKEADTVCSLCGVTLVPGATISKDTVDHTYTTYVSNGDAKCGVDGTETATCDVCHAATDTRTEEGSALTHNGVLAPETAVAATCAKDGKEADTVCSLCGVILVPGATISKDTVDHTFTNYVYNNDATYGKDGTETATCDVCGVATDTRTAAGTALKGVKVTVLGSELGNVYVNGEAVADEATVDVANNADVTLKAEANKDAMFAGWAVNGKIVSTDAEITIKALADVTYTPVFQAKTADKFTVVFTDRFGNVYDTQTVASGAEITVPAGPVIPGYDFVGWSMTNEEIAALTSAATINARYERITAKTYTVTANGCTITTPYATTTDVNTGIGYDTLVTVTAPGATAWKIGDAFVAYGDSYSFYVGSDVELTVVKSAVTATPRVAAVSTTEIGSAGALKASFLATRSMVAGATYVNAGFVFAVNPADARITLADVDGTTVLKSFCATDSEQFCLNIGRREQTGTIVARAFLAYVDEMGTTHVVYAEPQSYSYH